MKTLYESILDTDIQVQSDTLDKPLEQLVEFLLLDDPREVTCKYEIKNGKLYVSGVKNRVRIFQFISTAGVIANKRELNKRIDIDLMNLVYFEKVQISINIYTPVLMSFLSNCNNCVITYAGYDDAYKGLDKLLSKTKGNTIKIDSKEHVERFLYDFSCISDMDLGKCRVVLDGSADLSTIKNLTARELIIQRGGKFEKDGPIFEAERELSDYFVQKLDEFLARNKITSLGMVDAFVHFIDWFVKEGDGYKIVFLNGDKKRVPKVK